MRIQAGFTKHRTKTLPEFGHFRVNSSNQLLIGKISLVKTTDWIFTTGLAVLVVSCASHEILTPMSLAKPSNRRRNAPANQDLLHKPYAVDSRLRGNDEIQN